MVKIVENLVPRKKYAIKCPFLVKMKGITVHNTANDASAMNEINYMISTNVQTSFHFAVDDKEAVQGLPLDRNGWHASDGNGPGNLSTIAIEICYSKSGGERFDKAEENAAELIAMLCKKYGWGIDRIKRHYDYAPNKKYCPHRTMDKGWGRFLDMVKEKMGDIPAPKQKGDVYYQTWDDVKNKWLPNVKNNNDYAGIFGHDICATYISSNVGDIYSKIHYKGGRWLSQVKNREDYAGILNKPADAIMIKSTSFPIKYRVHLRRTQKWLPWVTGYNTKDSNNGYAGIIGQEIDAIEIKPL